MDFTILQQTQHGYPPANGVVFEVRQGYKSKDSKRQNADIDNATAAWTNGYLPVFIVFSTQIDRDIILRYQNSKCGVLTGIQSENNCTSLFAFCKTILDYDLEGFFKRNQEIIKREIQEVLTILLDSDGTTTT